MTFAEEWANATWIADRLLHGHQNSVAEDEPALLIQRIAQNPIICGGPVEHFSQSMPIWAPKTAEEDLLRTRELREPRSAFLNEN